MTPQNYFIIFDTTEGAFIVKFPNCGLKSRYVTISQLVSDSIKMITQLNFTLVNYAPN